jgi:hypothetical protein
MRKSRRKSNVAIHGGKIKKKSYLLLNKLRFDLHNKNIK